jgi:deazaflavin-dependent oxidoreductase (nitroreductase family)
VTLTPVVSNPAEAPPSQPVVPAEAPPTPPRRTRSRQPVLLTWLFRVPVGLYHVGLAKQLGRSMLLLTTRGRKTDRLRTTPLNYLVDNGATYVVSGSGASSDWLRNLQANPHVQVQIGTRRFDALAEVIVEPAEHRRILCLWADRSLRSAPPAAVRRLMRRIGFDYTGSVQRHLEENPPPPIVALRPVSPTT